MRPTTVSTPDGPQRRREVQLIDEQGRHVGVVSVDEALAMAKQAGLDLVLVDATTNPPLVQIKKIDYGEYRFEFDKSARLRRKNKPLPDFIEIKMRYKIEEHDYQVKLRKARELLVLENKIKLVIPLRGRETQYSSIAFELAKRFSEDVKKLATINKDAKIEGRAIIMILSPISPKR